MPKAKPVRVIISRNPDKMMALARLVLNRHLADAAQSPLLVLQDHNWADNAPRLAEAETLQVTIKQMERDLERKYRERDLALKPVDATVRASRDILLGIHRDNPRKLGDWGFEVNDTPRPNAHALTTALPHRPQPAHKAVVERLIIPFTLQRKPKSWERVGQL